MGWLGRGVVFVTLITGFLTDATGGNPQPDQREITREEAKQLAYQVVQAWGSTKLPGFTVVINDPAPAPGYFMGDGIFVNAKPRSYLVSHVLIDQGTADVFNSFGC